MAFQEAFFTIKQNIIILIYQNMNTTGFQASSSVILIVSDFRYF